MGLVTGEGTVIHASSEHGKTVETKLSETDGWDLLAVHRFIQPKSEGEKNMSETKTKVVEKTVKTGISFGSALAMVISYTAWKSIGWAIFHGTLNWAYVIYYVIRY